MDAGVAIGSEGGVDGAVVGVSVGTRVGVAVGDGLGVGDAVGVGDGTGVTVSVGDGVGVTVPGIGVSPAMSETEGVGVASGLRSPHPTPSAIIRVIMAMRTTCILSMLSIPELISISP